MVLLAVVGVVVVLACFRFGRGLILSGVVGLVSPFVFVAIGLGALLLLGSIVQAFTATTP